MQYLYGSQNFGYDTPESDTDWVQIVIPTWNDLMESKTISKQISGETGITKVKDIRHIISWFNKQNLSDMQFLFSLIYTGDDKNKFNWFIDNRDELIRTDMWGLYKHTGGTIRNNIIGATPKNLTRAAVYIDILRKISEDKGVETFRDIAYGRILYDYKAFTLEQLLNERSVLRAQLDALEPAFKVHEGTKCDLLLNAVREKVGEIIKESM